MENDMRKEIENWLLQGKEEFDTAKISFDNKKYFASAFWCQQSLEKIFKAIYIHKKKEPTGTTHSLTFLGREINIPKEYLSFLRDLTKEYYLSRYPDVIEDVPYITYTKEEIQNYLKKTEEVIKWAESQLKKQSKN